MSGWIKIHRKFDKWEWRSKPEMVSLFLHMLTEANHEDRKWQGHMILRGQVVFGRLKWAETLGISERSLRTCIERLKSTSEVTIKTTNKFSIITIVKYNDYQVNDSETTSITTSTLGNERPATDQQPTTPKELKKERKNNTPLDPPLFSDKEIPKTKKVRKTDYITLAEVTVDMLDAWVKKNLKAPIDVKRELLKCQSWDFKREVKDGLATAKTWMIRAEKDYVTDVDKPKSMAMQMRRVSNNPGWSE